MSAILAIGLGPQSSSADEVVVFAAASLANALELIEAGFEIETGHDLVVSLAGSSVLARQIELGAPADIFISASSDWMDVVEAAGFVEANGRFDLLGNRLVIVASDKEAKPVAIVPGFGLADLLGERRLAMALIDSVPAGVYGKAALESLGVWESVADRVAQADNVRAALAFVATGEAPFGIVYATDAAAESNVSVVGTFPVSTHPPIVYPVADLTTRDTVAEAVFLDYLRGARARDAFERQGFAVLTP